MSQEIALLIAILPAGIVKGLKTPLFKSQTWLFTAVQKLHVSERQVNQIICNIHTLIMRVQYW